MSFLMKQLYLQLFVASAFGFSFPSYIERCKRNDQLSQCISRNIDAAAPYLGQGIPKLYMPPLNPLTIKDLKMENPQMRFKSEKLLVYGLDKFSMKDIEFNLDDCTLQLNAFLPSLTALGVYSMKGSIIMLTLEGSGDVNCTISNIDVSISMKGSKMMKNGKEHILFKDSQLDMKVHGPNSLYFGNLFGSNEEISRTLTEMINENSEGFLDEMLPALKDGTIAAIELAIRTLFEKRSLDELFI